MIRYLVHPDGRFWHARVDDDVVEVREGVTGEEGEVSEIDTYEDSGTPPEYALDDLALPMIEAGFVPTPIPDVHLAIEEGHAIELPEPIRTFFANGTYLKYQGHFCPGLECHVDFASDAVLGVYFQTHFDEERGEERELIPLSAVVVDDIEDEQQWIGFDPEETNGAIYALYTSGDFDLAYESLAAFLADLEEA